MLHDTAGDILVVGDAPANLKPLTELLTAHGYLVRRVATGELAIRSAAAQRRPGAARYSFAEYGRVRSVAV